MELVILPGVNKFKHKLLDVAEPFFLELAGFDSYVAEVPAFPAVAGDVFVTLREAQAPAVFLCMGIEPFAASGQSVRIFYVSKIYCGA